MEFSLAISVSQLVSNDQNPMRMEHDIYSLAIRQLVLNGQNQMRMERDIHWLSDSLC